MPNPYLSFNYADQSFLPEDTVYYRGIVSMDCESPFMKIGREVFVSINSLCENEKLTEQMIEVFHSLNRYCITPLIEYLDKEYHIGLYLWKAYPSFLLDTERTVGAQIKENYIKTYLPNNYFN